METADEVLEVGGAGGVDDPNALERDVEASGGILDDAAFAEQDRCTHAAGDDLAGGLEDARVGAFRKHETFRMALELFDEPGNDRHG